MIIPKMLFLRLLLTAVCLWFLSWGNSNLTQSMTWFKLGNHSRTSYCDQTPWRKMSRDKFVPHFAGTEVWHNSVTPGRDQILTMLCKTFGMQLIHEVICFYKSPRYLFIISLFEYTTSWIGSQTLVFLAFLASTFMIKNNLKINLVKR